MIVGRYSTVAVVGRVDVHIEIIEDNKLLEESRYTLGGRDKCTRVVFRSIFV